MRLLHYLLLAIVLCATFWYYGFYEVLFMRPNSVHMWRQSDCASYALNYYQNDMPFFTPQTHTQTGKNGHAASEFPVVYFAAAKLYGVFGPQEFIVRLLNLFIFCVGLYCLFALARELTESMASAWLVVLFVVTSTYLVYYANNFLVNTSALALAFCGWRVFFLYKSTGKIVWLAFMVAVFVLAALLKVDAGISMATIGALLAMEALGLINVTPQQQKNHLTRAVLFVVGIVAVFSWYAYAAWFNKTHGTGQNLLGIFPIWESSREEILHTFNRLGPGKWAPHFQSYPALALTGAMFVYLWVKFQALPSLHRYILFWLTLGCSAYFLLWFRAFADHDYYLVNLAVLPVFVWLLFLYQIHKHWSAKLWAWLVIGLFVLSGYNIYHTRQMMDERFTGKLKESAHPAIYTIEPYLRSIGIARTDLVVSVPDPSPNITLYLMNNPGFTEAFNSDSYNINYFSAVGAKYLVISDSSYLGKALYQPYLHKPIGHYRGVNIYKLQ